MGAFFAKRKRISRVTDQDKAILQLKIQRDNLKRFQQKIEQGLEGDRLLAKRLLSEGKKDRAKLLLRKKRYQETLLAQTDGQLENLEKMTQDLEFSQIEMKVVEGLREGSQALKKINELFDIGEIEAMMDETREGIEKQKEIDELISGALSTEDEEVVENELAQLISENVDVSVLPEVPTTDLPTEEREEIKRKKIERKEEKVEPIMVPA